MNLKDLIIPEYDVHLTFNSAKKYEKIEGTPASLLTALSFFVEILKKNNIAQNDIEFAVKQGFWTEQEVKEHAGKKIEELLKILK